jgi:hypothetical protein
MTRIATTSFAPLTALKMAAALNAFYASDDWHSGPRENIVGSIETSIKTVMNLPTKNVEGCGCNRRLWIHQTHFKRLKIWHYENTTLNKRHIASWCVWHILRFMSVPRR